MAIVLITYAFGSGAEEIGHVIEKELGYEYVALGEILKEATQEGKRWERFSVEYGEDMPNMWERYDWSYLGYIALAQRLLLEHALKDNVIIMTRGAYYLMQGIPHVLSVRVVAPLDKRIRRVMEKENMGTETAGLLVEHADREAAAVTQQLYGKKWDDPDAYEIIFDTSVHGMDHIVNVVKGLITEKDKLKTREAQRQIEMRALAAKIKAVIFTNPRFLIPTLEVKAGQDGIVMRGVARSIKEHKAIDEEVKKISGETPVTCEIHYRGVISFKFKPHRI